MNETNSSLDYENRRIQTVAFLAFILNLLLALIKVYLAKDSSSLAITASAIDSASDSFASLAVFIGLILSTRKTESFPMGLYKIENVISVVISFLIFFVGYEIAKKMLQPVTTEPEITLSMVLWLVGATLATFGFGQYAYYMGKKTESPTLIAEGRHRQADVLSSLVVLIAVVLNYYDIDFQLYFLTIDRMAALLVLIFIAHAGWELLSDGMRVLLDASIDYKTLDKIRSIIKSEPAVENIASITGRNAGRFRFVEGAINLKISDFKKAHDIVDRIEERIKEEIPHVERVMLHYAPSDKTTQKIAFPANEKGDKVYEHFGEAPFFVIFSVQMDNKTIMKKTIQKNPYAEKGKGKGMDTAQWLVDKKIDILGTAKQIGKKGPGYVFSDAGVHVMTVEEENMKDALEIVLSRI